MVEIPESLLRRSAEAKAKALGVPVEQVLAEMKGEGPPVEVPELVVEETPSVEETPAAAPTTKKAALPEEAPPESDPEPELEVASEPSASPAAGRGESLPEVEEAEEAPAAVATMIESPDPAGEPPDPAAEPPDPAAEPPDPAAEPPDPETNVDGNGKVAGLVSPRPTVPPTGTPEGVRTQRLLTVVKARAIQNVKAEPTDKVNTWPHLMLMEFGALLLITGILVIMAVVIHSPLLDPANFNATPNPSKAPWYFLGLQELLSYFDPQVAGVLVPLFVGLIGFMMVPFVDKNPSTRPSDRKFAILLYSIFLAGSATLTIIGVLFRGKGFNWSYPWKDGIFFDDLKDWVDFE